MIAPAYVVQLSDVGGVLVLGIGGDVDCESRDLVERVLLAEVGSAPTIVLELDEVTFCDSAGIAMFIAVHAKAEEEGTRAGVPKRRAAGSANVRGRGHRRPVVRRPTGLVAHDVAARSNSVPVS